MKKFILTPLIALLSFGLTFNLTAQDLMITGVVDADLSGGLPKAIELYVVNDITDLSVYGVAIAFNGATSAGAPGYNFPADAITAGTYIYLASSTTEFNTWFGFNPTYTDGSISINGDDAVELYSGTTVIDVYGAVGTDGTGQPWEYADGWAYRVDGTTASATFTEADWTFANGALDTYTDNASAANPFPIGTFTMGGGGLTLPFYETYETWPLDNWTIVGDGTEVWESDAGSTHGPGSVTEGTLAAMFDVYSAARENTTTMTTDVIDMNGAVNPTLSFDFWTDGSADTDLWLKVEMTTDGSIWNEIFYQEQDGSISNWTSESILLIGVNATTQIRIIGSSDYGSYNLFVDNLSIVEVTCPAPSDLALNTNTVDEATFSWTENGTATAWNLIYGAPGFDPLTAGTTVAANANPFTITGLTAATNYEVYVQTDCGSGDLSTMTGAIAFTTDCDVFTAPYTQDFENGGNTPTCWTNESVEEQWEFGTTAGYGPSADHTSGTGYFAWVDDSSPHSTDVVLTSPVIDITSLTNPTLYFWLYSDNNGASNMTLNVDVWDGTIWNNAVASYATNTTGWTEMLVDLSAYSGNVQVRFHADETTSGTGYENDIAIDDVSFDEEPSCYTPSNIAIDAFTATTATLSWTENGTATSWSIVYGAPGFDPLTAGTTVAANANPFTVDPLTADTDYEFYVQADCGGGDLSSFTGPVSVYTGYCQPAPSSVDGNGITNVTFGETSIVNNTTTTETNNYGDYSSMVGDGAQGTDINVSITFETSYTYGTKIWVDWNNDLVFNDAEELVYTGLSATDNPTTLNATLSIPLATPLSNYRMRIGGTDADSGPSDACYTGSYGSFEDYTLEVTEAPACPVITGLTTTGIGTDFATIDWNALGSSEWNIKISDVSIDPGTEAGNIEEVNATTTKPYTTTTTLTPNTTYYFYVQATCGATWSAEGMFTTNCETITTLPWTETFELASLTSDCWSQIQETGTKEWTFDEGSSGGTITTAYEGTLNAVFTSSSGGPHITKLVSPVLDLSSGSVYVVDFYYGQENWYSDQNSLKVYYRENETAAWTEIGDYQTEAAAWTFSSIMLPNVSATYQIAFEGTDNFGYANVIDNVTVREASSETDILTYSFTEQTGAATIDDGAHTVAIEVGNGTDLATLVADFTLSTGATAAIATIDQESGTTANDFSSGAVTYTVTAEDGLTIQDWEVTVTEAPINTETDILTYTFPEATTAATIDDGAHTVNIEVAWNADVTTLVADFTLSYGASAEVGATAQTSGVTANDFTDPVVYTVTAEDGATIQDWTVTVTVQDIPVGATCADPFNYGTINDPEVVTNIDTNGRELWYTFTITEPYMNIQVSTCASVYDTKVWVYDACEGNELAYNDDAPTDFCDVDNNQSLAEIDFLEAGTYYVLITPYSASTDISDPTTGLLITGTMDYITPYVDNTTLTLTPETQNVATGNDANGVLDIVYPTTVSDGMPVDMMTDVMINLSELTAGAVVELFDGATSLGTYTVTGGETVWASVAFTGVYRIAADMTEGQILNLDVVISGLTVGTYNVSTTLYLGLDADLTAETNITEAATDAMEIIVADPIIDLELIGPEGEVYDCGLVDPVDVPVEIENVGNTTIATGETITFYLDVNGSNEITENIVLTEDLLPGEILETTTTNTVDFSALDTYEWEATITYTDDTDPNNNFTTGYFVHFEQEIEFVNAVNDTITIASTDWPYTIETNLTLSTDSVLVSTYEWELDGSTETNLTVDADGWYILHVITEDCATTDSVYVLAYNNIEGITADEFSVYPNPNNGQFMIEMNLVEKQDVLLSIFNSNGQLVREFKFDDIDSFARQIDMNNVAEGLYLIRINAGGEMFNSQIVIQ